MSEFFKGLKQTGISKYSLEIVFSGDDQVSVVIMPKTDVKEISLNMMKPLVLRGPIQDVDREFFRSINKPMEEVNEMFSNIEQFNIAKSISDKESAAKKVEKESAKKKAEELKEKLDKAFKQLEAITGSEGYDAKKEKDKVLKALDNIFAIDPDNKKAIDFKENLIKITSVVSLFDDGEL